MGKLNAKAVKHAKPGVHVDGKGLLLRVRHDDAKSWVLRVQFDGIRRDIGLGSVDILSLAEAREKAAHLRKIALTGGDPIAERDKAKRQIPTFARAVELTHAELGQGWAAKTADQFLSSLETHAVPRIGRRRVDQIETEHVIAALAPIWTEKPQIARKVRHRIIQTLAFAKSRGWRENAPPDAKEITRGLAKQPKPKGFAAMPYGEIPTYVTDQLGRADSPARLGLLFTILTAARSGETRHAEWSQIDREAKVWHRPADIMKAGEPHTVALNNAALEVLDRAAAAFGTDGVIFPNGFGKPLTDAAMSKLFRDSGRSETVHGFRSSFRDWAAERMPMIPAMVAEMALAHSVGTAVEKAYLRSDLLEQRHALMTAWGQHVAPALQSDPANVVALHG